jgi:ADP-heptose:LPS heptosyltransferase
VRYLAIFHKQIGDLVLLEPTLRRLAQASSSAVDLITRSTFEPLVSLMPAIRFRSKPSLRAYDALWCFDGTSKSAFFSLLSRAARKHLLIEPGAPVRWNHRTVFSNIFAPDLGQTYIAEYYWRHTDVGSNEQFGPPKLEVPPAAWDFPLCSKGYLHVNPTSGWKSKNWTPEKWACTIDRLMQLGIGPTVMTSGRQEWQKEHCERICQRLKSPIENVAGLTTLEGYLSIIWRAKLVLTVDGSASHIAAAYQRKCVTLFGHTSPMHWHRETGHSRAVTTGKILGEPCAKLKLLPEEPVIAAVAKLWETPPSG